MEWHRYLRRRHTGRDPRGRIHEDQLAGLQNTLQCPPELLARLKGHRETQDAEREKAGDRREDHDLVSATKHGTAIERTEGWKVILKQAGVRDVRVHDAGHTAVTLLIEQGVNVRVVQQVRGQTRATTTKRYTHVATLQMKDASGRMDSALWG